MIIDLLKNDNIPPDTQINSQPLSIVKSLDSSSLIPLDSEDIKNKDGTIITTQYSQITEDSIHTGENGFIVLVVIIIVVSIIGAYSYYRLKSGLKT